MEHPDGLCLVLGAGFSCGFGLPDTSRLWDLCLRKSPHVSRLYIQDLPNIYPVKTFLERGLRDIELLLTVWNAHDASLLEVSKWDDSFFEEWKSNRTYLRVYLECLVDWLYYFGNAAIQTAPAASLCKFFKRALNKGPLRVVTLNYDLIVERVLRECRKNVSYFQPIEAAETADEQESASRRIGCVPVAKPHGSINWIQSKERLGTQEMPDCAQRLWSHESGESIWAMMDHMTHSHLHGISGLVLPTIIPPAAGKQYDSFHQQILKNAYQYISSSATVAIIGYSFPQADSVIRSVVQLAMKAGRAHAQKVVFINPDQAAIDTAKNVLREASPTIISEPWTPHHLNGLFAS